MIDTILNLIQENYSRLGDNKKQDNEEIIKKIDDIIKINNKEAKKIKKRCKLEESLEIKMN